MGAGHLPSCSVCYIVRVLYVLNGGLAYRCPSRFSASPSANVMPKAAGHLFTKSTPAKAEVTKGHVSHFQGGN